jgi:TetR/AcrR family transcriptional regulator
VVGTTRRDAILGSAITEFAACGYDGARIERIAASAGANKQLIFHYFGSKDSLYEAAVRQVLSTMTPSVGEARTPLESLRATLSGIAEWMAANPGSAVAITECASGRDMPAGAVLSAADWIRLQSDRIRAAVGEGQRQGFFRDDVDTQAVAELVLGSLVGRAMLSRSQAGESRGSRRFASTLGQAIADYCAWR